MNFHAFVCDKCHKVFFAETAKYFDPAKCKTCGESCERLTRPSLTSDIGGAVKIKKDHWVDL